MLGGAAGNLTAVDLWVGATPSANDTRTGSRYNGLEQRLEMREMGEEEQLISSVLKWVR